MVDDPGTRREFQVGIDRMARKPNTQEGKANEQDGDEEGEEPLRTDCYASHACADIVQAVRRGSTDDGPVSSDVGKAMQDGQDMEAIAGQELGRISVSADRDGSYGWAEASPGG
jgi:hypothetical protein